MFKGTEHVPPESHAQFVNGIGGYVNAGTEEDSTHYINTLPADSLDFAIQLEAERMRHLLFRPDMIAGEREVVKEEIRQQENSPIAKGFLRFLAVAYTKHPYAWTAGGTIADLDNTTPEDLRKFYDTYYQPNNAMLIVVGKTTIEQVKASADKWFGAIPKGAEPPRPAEAAAEPEQTAQRRETVEPSQIGITLIGWHIPPAKHQDIYALQLAALILGNGESSRLKLRLKSLDPKTKRPLALEGAMEAIVREHPGLISRARRVSRSRAEGWRRGRDLRRRRFLGKDGPKPRYFALRKAKNQVQSGFLFSLENAQGLAGGDRPFVDPHRRSEAVPARHRAVREGHGRRDPARDQAIPATRPRHRGRHPAAREVMRTPFTTAIAAIAIAACGSPPKPAVVPTLPGDGDAHVAKPTPIPVKPGANDPWTGRDDLIAPPTMKAPAPVLLPPIEQFTLKDGLQVYVIKSDKLPIVSMQLAVRAGRENEPRTRLGVAEFTADMLVKGTAKHDALGLAKAIDFVGGTIAADATFEATLVSCSVLSRNTSTCLELLPEIVVTPTFPDGEISKIRDQLIAGVKQRLDDAGLLASALRAESAVGQRPRARLGEQRGLDQRASPRRSRRVAQEHGSCRATRCSSSPVTSTPRSCRAISSARSAIGRRRRCRRRRSSKTRGCRAFAFASSTSPARRRRIFASRSSAFATTIRGSSIRSCGTTSSAAASSARA